jgi:hypothetical protein
MLGGGAFDQFVTRFTCAWEYAAATSLKLNGRRKEITFPVKALHTSLSMMMAHKQFVQE